MSKSCAEYESEHCYCTVSVSFTCEDELTERAAAEEYACKACEYHSEEVPKSVCVSYRLSFESQLEVCAFSGSSKDQVECKCADEDCNKSEKKSCLFEEYEITDSANHAETCALSDSTYYKSCNKAYDNSCMLGAGTFFREEDECGSSNEKSEQCDLDYREYSSFECRKLVCTLERIALLKEYNTYEDSADKSEQTYDCVKVAACKSQNHSERASEEHKSADHNEESEYESRYRGASASWRKFFLAYCKKCASEYKTYDFRSDVLYRGCSVKSERTCRVTQEACNTESHICRVSQQNES